MLWCHLYAEDRNSMYHHRSDSRPRQDHRCEGREDGHPRRAAMGRGDLCCHGLQRNLVQCPGSELSMQSPAQAVVGDTFPVGLPFSDKNVFAEYFKLNPDSANPLYNSGTGVYKAGCGLQHVHMSWGRCSWLAHSQTISGRWCEDDRMLMDVSVCQVTMNTCTVC